MIDQIQLPQLLEKLDLKDHVDEIKKDRFRYIYDLGTIDFVSLSRDEYEFFEIHDEIWCENRTEFFFAILENEEIHICDSKTKPDQENPIKNASIDSFRYGENSDTERKYLQLFKKENIDTGECYKEIQKFLKDRERITVDKDLIRNLEQRRKRIVELLSNKVEKEEIAQKLIDRCLFIRFLEDRAGRNDLKEILEHGNLVGLLELLDFYSERLNGDVFEKGDIPKDIDNRVVRELKYIFGYMYTRPDSQITLAPYSFENIPIILISNIYEEFLSKGERRSEGIVFTPENVVEYVVDEILKDNRFVDKIKGKKIKILDPACGSGVFLVKFLEKVIEKIEKKKGESLLRKKANIVENCLYGIDKNDNALRIAALSLYLKIIEGEEPEIINRELFSEGNRFMFPGLKENGILVNGDSLFGDLFNGEKFDIIVGNPPWGLKFTDEDKRKIKQYWPNVSKYQSSQYFLFQMEKWMKEDGVCGMVVNLSNFINTESKKFRNDFMEKYSLKSFVNLSRIKKITFGMNSESACIVFFTKPTTATHIDFFTPDLSYFSESTGVISEDNKSEVLSQKLKRNDHLWHIHALGYSDYADLLEFLDDNRYCLGDFAKRKGFEEGLHEWSKDLGISKEQFNKKYRALSKVTENHYHIIDSLKGFLPYFGKEKQYYLLYGPHLDRPRDLALFKGKKLIITRSWPMRASIDSDTTLFDTRFWIFKLKENYPEEYFSLFEAILNSKLTKFYLGVKYLLRPKGNYAKVNKNQLIQFPIPDLEKKGNIVNEIVGTVRSLKSLGSGKTTFHTILQDYLNNFVFELYDLDNFAVQQVEDYCNLERGKRRKKVSEIDFLNYCEEFIRNFTPFIREEFFLNADWYISEFFGAMIKFTISKAKRAMNSDNDDLEKFTPLIERQEIDRKKIFKEEKIKIYDDNKLYIYKSNKPKDWTKSMAIKDVKEEVGIIIKKWREM